MKHALPKFNSLKLQQNDLWKAKVKSERVKLDKKHRIWSTYILVEWVQNDNNHTTADRSLWTGWERKPVWICNFYMPPKKSGSTSETMRLMVIVHVKMDIVSCLLVCVEVAMICWRTWRPVSTSV